MLLTGPLGKWIGWASLAAFLTASATIALQRHDAAIRASVATAQVRAEDDQRAHTIAVLGAAFAKERVTAEAVTQIKEQIANAPATHDCAGTPSIRESLDWLRHAAGGGADRPGGTTDLPAAAGAADDN